MIWLEFKDQVRVLLTVDARRKGSGIESYIDSVILSGVIELQQYIPSLRDFNRDVFRNMDFNRDRSKLLSGVQRGSLSNKAHIQSAIVMKPQGGKVISLHLNRWPHEKAGYITMGCLDNCRSASAPGKIMMRPSSKQFHIYPDLKPDEILILDWQGVKTSFSEDDETVYDHRVAKAVSDYTKAHIVREVDKDLKLYAEYYGMYVKERASLFLDEKENSLFDMPSITEGYYSRRCLVEDTTAPAAPPCVPSPPMGLIWHEAPANPEGLSYGILPTAPTYFHLAAGQFTIEELGGRVGVLVITGSGVPAPPEDLASEYPCGPPTGLNYVVGVPTQPEDLEALTPPTAPLGLVYNTRYPPIAPSNITFWGLLPTAPNLLGVFPAAPQGIFGDLEANFPTAPEDLSYLTGPTGLDWVFSNASGTIEFPSAPHLSGGMHDGAGGAWVPERPTDLRGFVVTDAPEAPHLSSAVAVQYLLKHYVLTNGVLTMSKIYVITYSSIGQATIEVQIQ
jgi:hypothetical protein